MKPEIWIGIVGAAMAVVSTVIAYTRFAAQAPLRAKVVDLEASANRLREQLDGQTADHQDLMRKFLSLKSGNVGALIKDGIDSELSIGMKLLRADGASVYVLEPSRHPSNFIYLSALGPNAAKLRSTTIAIDKGKVGAVFKSGKLDNYSAARQDPQHFRGVDRKLKQDTKTMLTLPLEQSGKLIGVAQFVNKEGDRPFDQDDERTATKLARSLAEKTAQFIKDPTNFEVLGLSSDSDGTEATVLFCDLTNSSSLFQNMSTLTAIACINEYLERQSEIAFRHGATVDKYIGDGIMIRFNVPKRIEGGRHSEAAVKAAYEMQRDFRDLKQSWLGFEHPVSSVFSRVGVAAGPVYVATMGHPQYQSITIIGDAVNRAAHLCEAAPRVRDVIIVDREIAAGLPATYQTRDVPQHEMPPHKGTVLSVVEILGT